MVGNFIFSVSQLDEMSLAERSSSDGDRQKEDSGTVATAADTMAESVSVSFPAAASTSECNPDSGSASASSLVSPLVLDSLSESSSNCGTAPAFGSVFLSLSASADELKFAYGSADHLKCECAMKWSVVINGTRYGACQSPKGSSNLNLREEEDASGREWETIKERNTRLLITDRTNRIRRSENESQKCRVKRSRRPVKCSKQFEMILLDGMKYGPGSRPVWADPGTPRFPNLTKSFLEAAREPLQRLTRPLGTVVQ